MTIKRRQPKERGRVRSLPFEYWPDADQKSWTAACRPRYRLTRGGSASHLKEITRRDLARRYGYFMDFVQRAGGLNREADAAAYVTPAMVERFLAELQSRVGSVTVYGTIYKLRRMSQLLAPDREFSWLIEIEKDCALVMKPRSKFARVRYAQVIFDAGVTLMAEADASLGRSALRRAVQYRNGLMIAMLAYHPIRLKNFAALNVGQTLKMVGEAWWILLSAADTKEGRADERKLDVSLLPWLNRYLTVHRKVLMRRRGEQTAFWLSNEGAAMSYGAVERNIKRTTQKTLGIDISPHLFRVSASTTAATFASSQPHLGSALLHHTDLAVTEEYYNRATSLDAAKKFAALVRNIQGETVRREAVGLIGKSMTTTSELSPKIMQPI